MTVMTAGLVVDASKPLLGASSNCSNRCNRLRSISTTGWRGKLMAAGMARREDARDVPGMYGE